MIKNKMIVFFAFLFCLIMVCFPEITAAASKEAMSLWLNAIVPTLFPFIVIADFIQRTGVVRKIPMGVYPFMMAFLSGYPMGAKITGDAFRDGSIGEKDLCRMLSYSMITGPAFIIGSVGTGFLHSQTLGYILVASHYGGAFLNSLFYGGVILENRIPETGGNRSGDSYYTYLTDSILSGFRTIGIIFTYIMMFMIGTDLL